ncbi:MAG: endonuclease [Bacteroidetes bacterium]|nr:MAG: endonuclease [Bacteroidota bacterium]
MATFYIVHSNSEDKFYVGSSEDFEMQLLQHQKNHFPKGYKSNSTDWVPFFVINNIPLDTANRIAKHVKKMKSREYFESLRTDPEIATKLTEEFNTVRIHPDSYQGPF